MNTFVGAGARLVVASSQEAAGVGLLVGVLARGGAVLLDHIDGGVVHGGDDRHVSVSAGRAHPQVSGLGAGGLGDASGVGAAHHVRVSVPDGRDAVLLVHIALSQLDALVGIAGGGVPAAGAASALVLPVALRGNAVVAGHNSATSGRTGAGGEVVSAHVDILVQERRRVLNAGDDESRGIFRDCEERQNGEQNRQDNTLHDDFLKGVCVDQRSLLHGEVHPFTSCFIF